MIPSYGQPPVLVRPLREVKQLAAKMRIVLCESWTPNSSYEELFELEIVLDDKEQKDHGTVHKYVAGPHIKLTIGSTPIKPYNILSVLVTRTDPRDAAKNYIKSFIACEIIDLTAKGIEL